MSISYEATIFCDSCHSIIASSEPAQVIEMADVYTIERHLEDKAKSLGAEVSILTTRCADCTKKQTTQSK